MNTAADLAARAVLRVSLRSSSFPRSCVRVLMAEIWSSSMELCLVVLLPRSETSDFLMLECLGRGLAEGRV